MHLFKQFMYRLLGELKISNSSFFENPPLSTFSPLNTFLSINMWSIQQFNIILSQMNSEHKIVISVPRLSTDLLIPLNSEISPQEKGTQFDDKNAKQGPFKMHTSSLNINLGQRKNSAFSIYEGQICSEPQNENSNSEEDSNSFGAQPDAEEKKTRKWKKIKRSKREMNRLETKNLNRYFRSKINEMLRDIKDDPSSEEEAIKAEYMLNILNKSNNIMFSELREIIKDEWLQMKLTTCSGILLRYIHKGKMGTYSKMIMLKYYNKIMKAIRNPDNFSFWK